MNPTADSSPIEAMDTGNRTQYRIGFWAGFVASVGTAGFSVAQILQIVTVLRFPWDAILIYGFSFCIATPFMLSMLALHYVTPHRNKIWSHAAVLLSVMYAIYVNLNYVVQLATVVPMTLQGSLDQIRILDQTPHSLFWDVDALGYIFMGMATLFASPVFGWTGIEKWLRIFFLANGLAVPVISFVYFYPRFSTTILLLGSVWILTALGSVLLLTLYFARGLQFRK